MTKRNVFDGLYEQLDYDSHLPDGQRPVPRVFANPSLRSIAARSLLWLALLLGSLGLLWCGLVALLWLAGVATW